MKDHGNLIRAVARLLTDGAQVHLILAGRGVDDPGGGCARGRRRRRRPPHLAARRA